jgi:hypothetical protein
MIDISLLRRLKVIVVHHWERILVLGMIPTRNPISRYRFISVYHSYADR